MTPPRDPAVGPLRAGALGAGAPAWTERRARERSAPGIRLSPARTGLVVAGGAVLLVVAGTAVQLAVEASGHDQMYGLVPLLDLDGEANLPSFYSALLLASCAVCAALLTRAAAAAGQQDAAGFSLLGVLLAVMACDEAAGLHELLIRPSRELLGSYADGVLYFGWVVPGIIAVAIAGLALRRFVHRRPAWLRRRLELAALLYLGGALGMEMLGGRYAAAGGLGDLTYRVVLVGLEESLELAGAVVLLHALLVHLAELAPCLELRFTAPATRPQPH